jgi:hypothetical protein
MVTDCCGRAYCAGTSAVGALDADLTACDLMP